MRKCASHAQDPRTSERQGTQGRLCESSCEETKERSKEMKKRKHVRDGCFQRSDRKGWFISYLDAQGRRRKEKVHAHTLQQARDALTRKKDEVERIKVL